MPSATTLPIPQPQLPAPIAADTAMSGPLIPPIERIRLFSSSQWEAFVLEWVDSLRARYASVEKCAGAGDMGRDVVALMHPATGSWHNYQCKHYDHPLIPTDIWIELGKLVYYTKQKEFTYPDRYFFVAPQGAGTTLSRLLKQSGDLKSGLLTAWDRYVRTKITSTGPIELDADMRAYVAGLDFSIFEAIPPLRIIDEHAKTRWYISRFGGGLPPRPEPPTPPLLPTQAEANYVRQLLCAYADHLKVPILGITDLSAHTSIHEHFGDARREFYCAESLRTFSRDTLPPGEFERLQDDLESGVRDEIRAAHSDGYQRLLAVVRTARALQLSAHALLGRMAIRDRGGICHQLANDGRVRWVSE